MIMEIEKKYNLSFYIDSKIETPNSVIFKAQDLELLRDICVKGVRLPGENEKQLKKNLDVAMREVKVLVAVGKETKHVPTIYFTHFDSKNKILLIAMEWIDGETLKFCMEKKKAGQRVFIGWMIDLCQILKKMSYHQMQHKDIKPENIIIDKDGDLNLIDFNISLSVPNQVEGTKYYKAPEMERSFSTTDRSKVDMFAIGVMMYEYYAGTVPKLMEHYTTSVDSEDYWATFIEPKQLNSKINSHVNDVIVKCMQKNPKNRYRDFAELISMLRRIR